MVDGSTPSPLNDREVSFMSKSTEMRKNAHGMVKHAIHELDGPQGSVPDYRAVRAFLHLVDGYLELATSYELLEEMERGVYPPDG